MGFVCGCCFVIVKGMWERKPCDWPRGVPFLDPNNKIKERGDGGSKPTKEVLVPMLIHLVKKYVVGNVLTLFRFYFQQFVFIFIHYANDKRIDG